MTVAPDVPAAFFVEPSPERRVITFPEPPTGINTVPVGYDAIFTWDYGTQRADLRNLYEKAKDSQWNAKSYLAWDTDVDPESETMPDQLSPIFGTHLWDKLDKKTELPKLRRLGSSWMLSNFLHGEQGALMATAQILCAAQSADAKLYASTQVMDEARHVEAYDRYLREKIELTFPISPYLRQLLDTILQDSRWDMKYLGMQIMVEGLAPRHADHGRGPRAGGVRLHPPALERAAHQADRAHDHARRGASRRLRGALAQGRLRRDEGERAP
jgi:hypothetical protein